MKCATAAFLASTVWAVPLQVRAAENRVPLIVIDKVPLTDAIRNLARQAGFNFILDPRVPGSGFAAGRLVPEPSITVRWENVSAQEALSALLTVHHLTIVTNPATTVARIAPADQKVKPVPASQVGSDTNAPIPLVVMDQVPLREAIRKLAGQLHLNVLFDSKLSAPAFEPDGLISFRWENLTARQALAALLDNYGLVMEENRSTSSARITASPTTAPPKGKGE
jgi:hypothetical protein